MPIVEDPDALVALIALEPARASRNRHFTFFASPTARTARRRALVLRGVVRELCGAFGPARVLSCDSQGEIISIRYALPRIAGVRTVNLSHVDLSVLRVALGRRGVRLLPAALVARDEDHTVVARLVGHGEASLRGSIEDLPPA